MTLSIRRAFKQITLESKQNAERVNAFRLGYNTKCVTDN